MVRIVVQLTGGVGNQLFQYATARALTLRCGGELVLDTWSGFVRDYQYRRQYELDAFPLQSRPANALERVPFWLYRLENRISPQPRTLFQRKIYGNFIVESQREYLSEIGKYQPASSCWMTGYWQSPKYFQDYNSIILKELTPPLPKNDKFIKLGAEMQQRPSVSLGIRLYEESNNPTGHARDGKLKTPSDINGAIDSLIAQIPDPHFYVFCTHRSPLFSELHLPANTTFVTHDDGFEGALERLWLLSQCRHHLMTNSSFYWWGAWLSQMVYNQKEQIVLAANNFINQDSLLPQWQQF